MPAARGLKRTASKASGSAPPKIKKKHGVQLEIPSANKVKGRLVVCGQGDVGQLGLGEDIMEASRFKYVASLGDKIVDVCAGGMHTVALDSDGKVWTFGCNDEGALGRQTSGEGEEFAPGVVGLPSAAVAISAGDSHTAALLQNGDVYLWGAFRDSHGSMGLVVEGREGKSCKEPVRVSIPESAAAIASGGDHLLVLTVTGAVYSAGCAEQGQLGRLSNRSASRHARQGVGALLVPSVVTLKPAIRRVWAGYHATFALDANSNKMLAWGLNNYNQLGVTGSTKTKTALYTPMEADAFSSVASDKEVELWSHVAPGQHHTLALDSSGVCYAVGRCDYGRLGLGEGSGDAEALTAVPKLADKKVISIAAGTSSSYAVTDNGELYAWGMGSEGQLGTGDEDDQPIPKQIAGAAFAQHKSVKVSAGGQHTVVLVASVMEGTDKEDTPAVSTSQPQKAESKESKGKATKKQPAQKPAEETEISSTNSAEVMEVEVEKPEKTRRGKRAVAPAASKPSSKTSQSSASTAKRTAKSKKVNGEPSAQTPMETDETDKTEEKSSDKKTQPEANMMKSEKIDTAPQEKLATEPKADATTKSDTSSKTELNIVETAKAEDKVDGPSKTEMQVDESSNAEAKIDKASKAEAKIDEASKVEAKIDEASKAETKIDDVSKTEEMVDDASKTGSNAENASTTEKPAEVLSTSEVVTKLTEPIVKSSEELSQSDVEMAEAPATKVNGNSEVEKPEIVTEKAKPVKSGESNAIAVESAAL